MKNTKLLIAKATAELPRYWEFYDSIDSLILPPNTHKTSIHSSSPAMNRNVMIDIALKADFTHIFFVDDDQVFPPDTVGRLLSHDVDIVSGMYCRKFPPFEIIVMEPPLPNGMSYFTKMDNIGPNELIEAARVPAGCLLCKMSVFRIIPKPWFTIGQIAPTEWGDDLWFCDRVAEAGLKIHVDTSCCVGHITKAILTPKYVNGEWIIEHRINSEAGLELTIPKLPV